MVIEPLRWMQHSILVAGTDTPFIPSGNLTCAGCQKLVGYFEWTSSTNVRRCVRVLGSCVMYARVLIASIDSTASPMFRTRSNGQRSCSRSRG